MNFNGESIRNSRNVEVDRNLFNSLSLGRKPTKRLRSKIRNYTNHEIDLRYAEIECSKDIFDALFVNINFEGVEFSNVRFFRCRFDLSSFFSSSFKNCEFIDCTFNNSNVSFAVFSKCRFSDTQFWQCRVSRVRFESCQIDNTSNFLTFYSMSDMILIRNPILIAKSRGYPKYIGFVVFILLWMKFIWFLSSTITFSKERGFFSYDEIIGDGSSAEDFYRQLSSCFEKSSDRYSAETINYFRLRNGVGNFFRVNSMMVLSYFVCGGFWSIRRSLFFSILLIFGFATHYFNNPFYRVDGFGDAGFRRLDFLESIYFSMANFGTLGAANVKMELALIGRLCSGSVWDFSCYISLVPGLEALAGTLMVAIVTATILKRAIL